MLGACSYCRLALVTETFPSCLATFHNKHPSICLSPRCLLRLDVLLRNLTSNIHATPRLLIQFLRSQDSFFARDLFILSPPRSLGDITHSRNLHTIYLFAATRAVSPSFIMPGTEFNPSSFAGDMQLRTRKARNFDKVEHDLPDPRNPALQRVQTAALAAPINISAWLSRLANLNPFGKAVDSGDVVWLFDNTAYRNPDTNEWEAEFVAAVFENEPKCRVADIVSSIAKTLGLAEDAAERDVIEERIIPFLWDIQAARVFWLEHRKKELRLGPTSVNGITTSVMPLERYHKGSVVDATALVPREVRGILDMQTYYAGPEGWGIISDIDDTIKVTMTSDPLGILKSTFVDEPTPVPGMPELYSDLQSLLPRDTPWFYLSASPYNLYPLLRDFRDRYFPQGTLVLRDSSWRTVAGLLSALTMGTEEYKADRMKKVHSWLPKRKMIVIGDSTQSDPEAYGEVYRAFPHWIKMILIRKATDVASFGIEEKNQHERFEKAFKGVPRGAWHVFEDPSECRRIVRDVVRKRSW